MTIQSIAMQQALEQLRATRDSIKQTAVDHSHLAANGAGAAAPAQKGPSFIESMRSAVDSVNQQQNAAKELQTAYARGEDVSLTDVVISMQKSSVAFEATVQVRNKILESYREIMSMAI
jgi:flagellar hook-basal body complex protein FliE